MADVIIANTGPEIDGWTVRWTFAQSTTITQTWASTISETDAGAVTATNASYNAVIHTGQKVDFGWSARAASTTVPTDITINGTAC